MVKILERAETAGELPTRRTAVGNRHASNMDPVTLCYFRFGMLLPGWSVQTAIMIGFKQIEFFDHSATSESWHVQWETDPPGEESEPRSLGCIRRGNEAGEANRQSHPRDGERVTGPQRE